MIYILKATRITVFINERIKFREIKKWITKQKGKNQWENL